MKNTKTVIIGFDGGTFTKINPLVREGKLPNLAKLMQAGGYGELESTIHPITPQAWTSFMTGKNAGKHGIYDFFERKVGSYDIHYASNASRGCQTLWGLLNEHGKKVGLLNVPMTYPPEHINDFVIAGLGSPGKDSDFIYPETLKDEIVKEFGDYKLLDFDSTQTPEDYIRFQLQSVDETVELSKYLNNRFDLDVFMVVFMATDQLQHLFWHHQDREHPFFTQEGNKKYGDVVNGIYEKVDRALGELIEYFPPETNFIIMSDHGFGPIKKAINLYKWLEEIGLLTFQDTPALDSFYKTIISKVRLILDKKLKIKWKYQLKRLFPFLQGKVDSYLINADVDWSRTKAYTWGSYGNVIINVKGREPEGIVSPGKEYEELCEFITQGLYQLRDPETQEKVIEKVYRKEEIYQGDCVDKAPDLITIYKDYAYVTAPARKYDRNRKLFEMTYSEERSHSLQALSSHRLNGIFFVKGQAIKDQKELQGVKIVDVAPTILYLMGLPVPSDMDGRVLTEAIISDHINNNAVKYADSGCINEYKSEDKTIYSKTDKEEIEEKLKLLGYLE